MTPAMQLLRNESEQTGVLETPHKYVDMSCAAESRWPNASSQPK